jgi:type VI protein secretion system component Hcp
VPERRRDTQTSLASAGTAVNRGENTVKTLRNLMVIATTTCVLAISAVMPAQATETMTLHHDKITWTHAQQASGDGDVDGRDFLIWQRS